MSNPSNAHKSPPHQYQHPDGRGLFTAIVVALFLAIPYWRELRISSFAKFRRKGAGNNA